MTLLHHVQSGAWLSVNAPKPSHVCTISRPPLPPHRLVVVTARRVHVYSMQNLTCLRVIDTEENARVGPASRALSLMPCRRGTASTRGISSSRLSVLPHPDAHAMLGLFSIHLALSACALCRDVARSHAATSPTSWRCPRPQQRLAWIVATAMPCPWPPDCMRTRTASYFVCWYAGHGAHLRPGSGGWQCAERGAGAPNIRGKRQYP